MKSKIKETANNLKKAIQGEITLVNAVKYAESIGYNVIFFSSFDDEYINLYDLTYIAQNTSAFTYNNLAHIIFINDNISYFEKLHRILHEIGHIMLGHIGNGTLYLQNKDEADSEAEAFVYVLLYDKQKYNLKLITAMLLIAGMFVGFFTGYTVSSCKRVNSSSNKEEYKSNNDIVYVTPSGSKYHRDDCQYIKNKNCTMLKRSEAEKNYSPCSVCRP
ncbi:MAG: ImmA/IrrE family metallo-endopeptidase [Clostridia bacterium]|nr:ImmA/IrrE family metallo-endopeptidase [Clostridia bacterium]